MWEGCAEGQSGETDNTTIIFRDFNTSLSIMGRTNGQKINKEIENLNNTISQLDLTEHSTKQQNTHISQIII